jgi:hypothetical protein
MSYCQRVGRSRSIKIQATNPCKKTSNIWQKQNKLNCIYEEISVGLNMRNAPPLGSESFISLYGI